MEKRNTKRFLGAVLIGLFLIIAFVYVLDPFYHYHKPWLNTEIYLYNTVYQTPGVARNVPYDSAILGTSMTENFHTSWFDEELNWNTVKLSYPGARTPDLAAILEQIFLSDNDVKNIFMDINGYQLTVEPETAYVPRPQWLYDENVINDVEYLLNKDVFCAAMGRGIAALLQKPGNMDTAYCWEDPSRFGRQKAFDFMRNSRAAQAVSPKFMNDIPGVLAECDRHLEKVGQFIAENPNTTFYVFYPPYNILYWEELLYTRKFEGMCAVYERSMEYLLQFPNVKLFYFQDEEEIITNLDIYLDSTHYTPEINRYILECVRDGKNEITMSDYQSRLENMKKIALEFDYDALWQLDEG